MTTTAGATSTASPLTVPCRLASTLPRFGELKGVCDRGEPSFVQPSLLGPAGELAARLVEIAPQGLERVTFTNSGAEAIEAAIKLCRRHGPARYPVNQPRLPRQNTRCPLRDRQHRIPEGLRAPAAYFDAIPFGDAAALRLALAAQPGHYAAFLVEPIQGEGGIVEPPLGYLAEVRAICREAGVLLVFDEIPDRATAELPMARLRGAAGGSGPGARRILARRHGPRSPGNSSRRTATSIPDRAARLAGRDALNRSTVRPGSPF